MKSCGISLNGHVVGRGDVNGFQAPRLCPFDVLGEVIEEHNALRRNPDRPHDVIIGFRIRFPKAN